MNSEISKLAAYALYSQLYDNGNYDTYNIISMFIENIIDEEKLFDFNIVEMVHKLKENFGFDIPQYVVQSSLKRLTYLKKEASEYRVVKEFPQSKLSSAQKETMENLNKKIESELIEYANKKKLVISSEKLIEDFCAYLLDETSTSDSGALISAFILSKVKEPYFEEYIQNVKEGAILFAGVNYTNKIEDSKTWTDKITIYVETEILFYLAGYNGTVFQKLAQELFELIKEMNNKNKKRVIEVKIFPDVEEEINKFFTIAEGIVSGKHRYLEHNEAMSAIINGCKVKSDIVTKKTIFNTLLKHYSISKDVERDYYSTENNQFNIESPELYEKFDVEYDKERYIKHLNYINILRVGSEVSDFKKSKYLLITNVSKILTISREISSASPLALSMFTLTNRLWYDLNKGFGQNTPISFNVVQRSRIILSTILSQSLSNKYDILKRRYEKKELSDEALIESIIALRGESRRPEEIEEEIVDDVFEFITEKQIRDYKADKEVIKGENRLLQKQLFEREEEYQKVLANKEKVEKEHTDLKVKNQTTFEIMLEDMRIRKRNADKKVKKIEKCFEFIICMILILIFLLIISLGIKYHDKMFGAIIGWINDFLYLLSIPLAIILKKRFDSLDIYNRLKDLVVEKYRKKYYEEYNINIERMKEMDGNQ